MTGVKGKFEDAGKAFSSSNRRVWTSTAAQITIIARDLVLGSLYLPMPSRFS